MGNWSWVIGSSYKLTEVSGGKNNRPQCIFFLVIVGEFAIPHLSENCCIDLALN
ncbi:hypothetical protein QUB60_23055 [Microcoleus sp. A2-C5]|uniref:hypothetical protein n=1 Tax=Microcoleaceae TaxID=1892252 RepID=UPI002237AA89|nr:hypothetical protein [Lyngbya sp. CCAP 1446/10]MCW6048796.1 hypothetical protein [Lyngbya sp. CCAP 1446/10]